MQRVFNADDNDVPFMLARVRPDVLLAFSPGGNESHVPGWHLNARLNAEDAAGIDVDEHAIEKHRRAGFFSFRGTVALPLIRQFIGGPLVNFAAHNICEGVHALHALVKYRRDDTARETALILGRFGYPQYFEDAERMIRGDLLPSKLRDIRFIATLPNPQNEDGRRDVARRLQGAWGFPAPYGHEPLELEGFGGVNFDLDIVGGVAGSLCEAYRSATRFGVTGHYVDLLFDHKTEAIRVESMYTHPQLRVTPKKAGALRVRLPSWLAQDRLTFEGVAGIPRFTGSYVFIPQQPVGQPLTFRFDLPIRDVVVKHRTRNIRARLRGDAVVATDNFGADLTFFDGLDS